MNSLPMKAFPDKECKVIGVLSGKGGVGKTFVSSTLSYGMASKGLSVLVIDMDTGLRNLDIVMGVEDKVVYNVFDVLERGVKFENALIRAYAAGDDNVPWIMVTDHLKTKNAIASAPFRKMLEHAKDYFDIIMLDGPAGIEYGADIVAGSSDELYIVCNQEFPSLRAGKQLKASYGDLCPMSMIVNSYYPSLVEKNDGGLTPENAALFTGINVIAAIPWDIGVRPCGHRGVPIWYCGDVSPARRVVAELADKLYEASYEPLVVKTEEEPVQPVEVEADKVSEQEGATGAVEDATGTRENPSSDAEGAVEENETTESDQTSDIPDAEVENGEDNVQNQPTFLTKISKMVSGMFRS